MTSVKPATKPGDVGDKASNIDVAEKQETNVEGTVAATELTMVDVFSSRGVIAAWVALFLVALLNYLDLGMIYTFQVYAVSEFDRLSIEGALMTAISVAVIAAQPIIAILVKHTSFFSVFVGATFFCTFASIIQAAAPSLGPFLLGFVVNSIGGLATRLLMFSVAMNLSTPRYRGFALALVNVPSVISLLAGAQASQAVLKDLGWRWGYGIWSILLPVTAPAFCVSLFIFRRRTSGRREAGPAARARQTLTSLLHEDLVGIFLLIAGMSLLLLPIPLEQGGVSQYASARLIVPTAIGFLILVAFIAWELRFAKLPLLPLEVLTNRTLVSSLAANLLGSIGLNVAAPYFFPFLMVRSELSISNATYITLTAPIVLQLTGLVYGAVMVRFRRIKWIMVWGLGLQVVGRGIHFAFPDPETQMGGLIASQVLTGLGLGISIHFVTVMQAVAAVKDHPIVLAAFFVSANAGGSIGGAISGAVWTSLLPERLQQELPLAVKDQALAIMNSLPLAQSFPLGSAERTAINNSYLSVFNILLIIILVSVALAFLAGLFMEDITLPDDKKNGDLEADAVERGMQGSEKGQASDAEKL